MEEVFDLYRKELYMICRYATQFAIMIRSSVHDSSTEQRSPFTQNSAVHLSLASQQNVHLILMSSSLSVLLFY
ncbi:hypothetical protein E2C01_006087 [Portunus trituberculatus]|uniref:Uncharacterized protein n=1 Tax=Portunus trituberculatus TaxID=210409 RepID=A0A5B7CW57_PORTR|nr:hypothetical protein [Portunus trituberculatus]